jgi:D-alanyl-D-alanine endopeptidase (penicillin-binding protein 7)
MGIIMIPIKVTLSGFSVLAVLLLLPTLVQSLDTNKVSVSSPSKVLQHVQSVTNKNLIIENKLIENLTLKLDSELGSAGAEVGSSPILFSPIAIIYDEQQKRTLFAKNGESIVPIASISKLILAMVVLDAQLPMNEDISISTNDIDMLKGTSSRLRPGMTLHRGELLKLALMSSENRAAAALARNYPGGTEAAIKKMNAKSRELGMKDTFFMDPTGLNSGNVSTAQDLVKMVLAAQSYEPIHEATTASSHLVELIGYHKLLYKNTNPLVKNALWDIGISKTGYINEAGRCLVMKANISHRSVVIVLLDSGSKSNRIGDANRIKKWMEVLL